MKVVRFGRILGGGTGSDGPQAILNFLASRGEVVQCQCSVIFIFMFLCSLFTSIKCEGFRESAKITCAYIKEVERAE